MQKAAKILGDLKESVLVVFLVVLFLTFILSQNGIPSESMTPTIGVKDRVLVTMLPFYYRSPKRGEIVVFNGPDGKKWVKRVIGLPGETIDIISGNVYVDGKLLDESAYLSEERISLPDMSKPDVLDFPYKVPEGSYFLMGDNRLASYDCRYIGAIREKDITGKAIFRVYPFRAIGTLNQ